MDRFTPPAPAVTVTPLSLTAADGYILAAHHWQPEAMPRAVVVINPATAVKAAYYHRYARFLAENGFAVLTYDYRGIGASRQGSLRRWRHVSKLDWGRYDCEAALAWARQTYPVPLPGRRCSGPSPWAASLPTGPTTARASPSCGCAGMC